MYDFREKDEEGVERSIRMIRMNRIDNPGWALSPIGFIKFMIKRISGSCGSEEMG
jgi:hypothetical protein